MSPVRCAHPVAHAEELMEEHRTLHVLLDRIAAMIGAPPPHDASQRWRQEIGRRLHDLRDVLRAHFAGEEERGLFTQIEAAWPQAAAACRRLQEEHALLVARFAELAAQLELRPRAADEFHALLGRARAACRDLARHEERENAFLVRSIEDEAAAQD